MRQQEKEKGGEMEGRKRGKKETERVRKKGDRQTD